MFKLLQDESGQAMSEYGLIIALVAVAVIGVLGLLGTALYNKFNSIQNSVNTAQPLGQ